ncbi:hypothetical protein BDW71DRAFT_6946 [Aspergillus fruticulosus]
MIINSVPSERPDWLVLRLDDGCGQALCWLGCPSFDGRDGEPYQHEIKTKTYETWLRFQHAGVDTNSRGVLKSKLNCKDVLKSSTPYFPRRQGLMADQLLIFSDILLHGYVSVDCGGAATKNSTSTCLSTYDPALTDLHSDIVRRVDLPGPCKDRNKESTFVSLRGVQICKTFEFYFNIFTAFNFNEIRLLN